MAPKGPTKHGMYVNSTPGKMRYLRITSGAQRGKYVHVLVAEAC